MTPRSGDPPRGDPGDGNAPGTPPTSSKVARDDDGSSIAQTDVPGHRPWARRPDAHAVELCYRRSVTDWQRRGWMCSRPTEPSTFGLTIGELRREVNRLVDLGWSAAEIGRVLDVSNGGDRGR